MDEPCPDVDVPGRAVELPGTAVEVPGNAVERPCPVVGLPGAWVGTPCPVVGVPGAVVELPWPVVGEPGAVVGLPVVVVGDPTELPEPSAPGVAAEDGTPELFNAGCSPLRSASMLAPIWSRSCSMVRSSSSASTAVETAPTSSSNGRFSRLISTSRFIRHDLGWTLANGRAFSQKRARNLDVQAPISVIALLIAR
ncbi:hypothetical protein [Pseudomonas solani]|uniref:hypothetical protein n=1 Tax=Pseudomonas solani TaxID=2731552 RepID=UPI0022368EE3|nr:hypothetical protein [Pseudomonas solani]